ncbi:MAG: hypothetical protein ABI426_06985 [Flavobacterium sp.]
MLKKIVLTLSVFLIFNVFANAQMSAKDSLRIKYKNRVKVTRSKENFLDKNPYAHTEPYYFKVYNADQDYISFQLGKRKGSKVFIYIKLFSFNACVKKDDVVELSFVNDDRYDLINKYQVNCEGYIVVELAGSDIKYISKSFIKGFMIHTYQKDYEFRVDKKTATQINDDIKCLRKY